MLLTKLCCLFFMQLGGPSELFLFVSDRYSSWEEYLKRMRQDGTWGDHLILVAVANLYKTCIRVLDTQSRETEIPPRYVGDNSEMLVLGHVQELHYVSLRPKEGNALFVCGHRCSKSNFLRKYRTLYCRKSNWFFQLMERVQLGTYLIYRFCNREAPVE